MKLARIVIILLTVIIGLAGYAVYALNKSQVSPSTTPPTLTANNNCTPAFADGGGPYYTPNAPFRKVIAPEQHNGEKLIVSGKILRSDCTTPAGNVILDIWQANESGNYEDVWYRGQIKTDNEGNYEFETVIPSGYGEGTGYRPPHIHFKVHENGQTLVTSQIFFPEVKGTPGFDDAYIMSLSTNTQNGKTSHTGKHNIILP